VACRAICPVLSRAGNRIGSQTVPTSAKTFAAVLKQTMKEPNVTAGCAVCGIMSANYDKANGVKYEVEIPMLPHRVVLAPSPSLGQ